MPDYLLIESRDPFAARDDGFCSNLAQRLRAHGQTVTVLLVQNGVLGARAHANAPALAELLAAGAEVLADDFALRERGISPSQLAAGIKAASLETVIERMERGCKAIWH